MARITISGVSMDPLVQSAELASVSLVSEEGSQSDYLLVQATHVPTAGERQQMAELGVVVHEYVPESTYLCGYRSSDLEALRALPFVAWADVYLTGFKIAPSLRSSRLRPAMATLAHPLESTEPGTHTVDVVLHDDIDAAVPQGTGHTLKITLVWTDPPGTALQNDLDLIVRADGREHHGNMGAEGGFDRVNNVEQVSWEGVPPGDAEVVVRAHRITQFAQPYALAWRIS